MQDPGDVSVNLVSTTNPIPSRLPWRAACNLVRLRLLVDYLEAAIRDAVDVATGVHHTMRCNAPCDILGTT